MELSYVRKSVRAVSPSEIGTCYNLVRNIRPYYEATPEGWDRRAKMSELKHTPGIEYLLVKSGRLLVAFASFVVDDEDFDCLYIWEIHVSPEFLRQGIGHTLIAELSDVAKEAGKPQLMLRCFRENLSAKKFYEREGFVEAPDLSDEFGIIYTRGMTPASSQIGGD